MRRTAEFLASLVLFAVLATLTARLDLPVPAPVVGLAVYMLLLSLGILDWTLVPARWLAGLLGAMIVPPLVGLGQFGDVLGAGGWRLAFVLVAGTAITGVATALLFRAAGGKA